MFIIIQIFITNKKTLKILSNVEVFEVFKLSVAETYELANWRINRLGNDHEDLYNRQCILRFLSRPSKLPEPS